MLPYQNSCGGFPPEELNNNVQNSPGRQWFTPVILATQEAEIRRIEVRSQPEQIVLGMVAYLPSKREAPEFAVSQKKKKKKKVQNSLGKANEIGVQCQVTPLKARSNTLQGQQQTPRPPHRIRVGGAQLWNLKASPFIT
jgi:hypothetical protein